MMIMQITMASPQPYLGNVRLADATKDFSRQAWSLRRPFAWQQQAASLTPRKVVSATSHRAHVKLVIPSANGAIQSVALPGG
jgi:hypothetical protein